MDVQLIGLAIAIILIVIILVTCFLVYGAREREFEEVYGDKSIGLLDEKSKRTSDKTKVKKDKPKHSAPKSKEDKEKSEKDTAPKIATIKQNSTDFAPTEPSTSKQADAHEIHSHEMHDANQEVRRRAKRQAQRQQKSVDQKENSSESEAFEKTQAVSLNKKQAPKKKEKVDRKSAEPVDVNETEIIAEQVTQYEAEYKPAKTEPIAPIKPPSHKEMTKEPAKVPKQHILSVKLSSDNLEAIMAAAQAATGITEVQKNALVECVFARDELEKKVQSLQSNVSTLTVSSDKRIDQLKRELDQTAAQLEHERAQAHRLHKQMTDQAHAAKEGDVLKQQMTVVMQENRALRETLERLRQDTSASDRVKQLEKENATLKDAIQNTSRDLQAKQNAVDNAMKQMESMKSQWNSARKEDTGASDKLRAVVQDKENECRQLREDLSHRCMNPPNECTEIRKTLAQCQMDSEKVRSEVATIWEEYNKLKTVVLEKEKCIEDMQRDGEGQKRAQGEEGKIVEGLKQQLESERAAVKNAQNELHQAQNQLAQIQAEYENRERDGQKVRADLISANERIAQMQSDQHSGASALQSELEHLRANAQRDCDQSQTTLASMQAENDRLKDELNRLKEESQTVCTNLAANQATIVDVKRQMELVDKRRHDAETDAIAVRTQLESVRTECAQLRAEANQLKDASKAVKSGDSEETSRLRRQIEALQLEVKSEKERRLRLEEDRNCDLEKLRGEIKKQEDIIAQMKDDAAMQEETIVETERLISTETSAALPDNSQIVAELESRIAQLQEKNAELREKNYKAVENVHTIEGTVQSMMKEEKAKFSLQLLEERRATAELLSKLLPANESGKAKQLASGELLEPEIHREWLHEIERIVKHVHHFEEKEPHKAQRGQKRGHDKGHQMHGHESGDVLRLREHNLELQETLAQLYNDLSRIEDAAQTECGTLRDQCTELQAELMQARQELSRREGAEPIHSETHTRELVERTNTVTNNVVDEQGQLIEQLALVRQQLSELRERLSSEERDRDALREQVLVLTQTLETERATARDLSSQAVKLRGMLKVGQDALRHEQSTVQQLKEQLRPVANGEHNELSELRLRLSSLERNLDREKQGNRTLVAKLAALGIAG